jgi:uncharacterized protein
MDDRVRVAQLLGREPQGAFDVVVRDEHGDPVVVRNAPFLDDGTPMPTRYYLVGSRLVREVSRLEADGGVRRAEAAIDPAAIADTHRRYGAERDAAIAADHVGPRPYGGVGGTRTGVKCLHAHVAHELAGGDDPVGRWALDQLAAADTTPAWTSAPTPTSDHVTLSIEDRTVTVGVGDDAFELPIGPLQLFEGPLERADPPGPAQLTNALGLVVDHLDDVIIAAPAFSAASQVIATGPHAEAMARVEIGADVVPAGYQLRRSDADEVFRTLAVESVADRVHNPGLHDDHVESIIGTCCVILGVMRRLDLASITIVSTVAAAGTSSAHADTSSDGAR